MAAYFYSIPTPPRVLSEEEQDILLKVTGEHRDGFRDHIIISIALGTGLREHELAALNVGDIAGIDGKIRGRVGLSVFKRSTKKPALRECRLVPRIDPPIFAW
ncbi:MAG: hypothetical protein GY847_07750 [Proteobacteria bacterium]|nr:hypothetical protein [Pseudomonadota bacterium]